MHLTNNNTVGKKIYIYADFVHLPTDKEMIGL